MPSHTGFTRSPSISVLVTWQKLKGEEMKDVNSNEKREKMTNLTN